MEYKSTNAGYGYVIRLEKSKKVIASLKELAEKEGLDGGFFYGLGAVKNAELGRFDVEKKKYEFQKLSGVMELASLNGNIALSENGEPVVHVHAVLGDEKQQVFAGHLKEAEVAVTCEIFLHLQHGARMLRKPDEELGLHLLHFE